MTTYAFNLTNILVAILLTFGLLTTPARAQTGASTEASTEVPNAWTALVAQEGEWSKVLTGETMPAGLADVNFDALTFEEWKELRAGLLAALRWPRNDGWEDAAVQAIYLARYYADRIDLDRAASPLLDAYLFDRNEPHRILALAALHSIGNHDTMAHLLQRMSMRQERSPRVRRLTVAALADHYGVRDYFVRSTTSVEVERPTPVSVKQR